jgi:hypothetical protein
MSLFVLNLHKLHFPSFFCMALAYPLATSASFLPVVAGARFDQPSPKPPVKRIDFPIRPHLLKYLQVHLHLAQVQELPFKASDYTLSSEGRFGFPLTLLLQKPAKSARYEGSIDDCTAALGVDLRNFKGAYAHLLKGELTSWAIFQFNEFVEGWFRKELYWWVNQHRERRATNKEAIYSFMAFYAVNEDDVAYETLKKDVQRNGQGPTKLKKKEKEKKISGFAEKVSPKTGVLSPKKGEVSPKTGVLSRKDTFSSVCEALMKLPLPLFDTEFFHGRP